MTKTTEFLQALAGVIALLEASKSKYNVTEILSEKRYEFFAVPHSISGFGGSLFRAAERTLKDDWGKARDTYDVPSPQVAKRLQEIRSTLEKGSLVLRHFEATFDPKSISLDAYNFEMNERISFIINFVPKD